MRLIDIINGPWAIAPEMLCEIRSIYAKHLRGEKIDKAVLEKFALENNVRKADSTYDVVDGTAIIPVEGVLAKKMNLFMAVSGGSSMQLIERDIRKALDDPLVSKIVLLVDSPGGTVDGTFELANFIYANRGRKPFVTLSDGMMYSAAYAIGSAAGEVYVASEAVGVGSIGVVAAHEDWSKWEERIGIKTTEVYAGRYKRAYSQYKPLDDEGRKSMQDEVDYLYSVFIDAVAKNRGVSPDEVLAKMSTDVQSAFIGHQAVEAGLVDGVATLDDIIGGKTGVAGAAAAAGSVPDGAAGGSEGKEKTTARAVAGAKGDTNMDVKELKAKHPDLYKAVYDEGYTKAQEDTECPEHCRTESKEEGKKEGAAAERARIKAVKEQAIPGHEELVEGLMFDGKTSGPEAAVAVLKAEKEKKGRVLKGLETEAPAAVAAPAAPGIEAPAAHGDDESLPVEERAKAAWDKEPKLRAEFGSYETYLHFAKAHEEGRVRVLSRK